MNTEKVGEKESLSFILLLFSVVNSPHLVFCPSSRLSFSAVFFSSAFPSFSFPPLFLLPLCHVLSSLSQLLFFFFFYVFAAQPQVCCSLIAKGSKCWSSWSTEMLPNTRRKALTEASPRSSMCVSHRQSREEEKATRGEHMNACV